MKFRLPIAMVVALTLTAMGCSSDSDDPSEVVDQYVAAYNSGDIDAVMAVFTEESELNGNAYSQGNRETVGLAAIRTLIDFDMALITNENAITISNVEVTGNTVTWDEVWDPDDSGFAYCQYGLSAEIEDGKFVTWTWPEGDVAECP